MLLFGIPCHSSPSPCVGGPIGSTLFSTIEHTNGKRFLLIYFLSHWMMVNTTSNFFIWIEHSSTHFIYYTATQITIGRQPHCSYVVIVCLYERIESHGGVINSDSFWYTHLYYTLRAREWKMNSVKYLLFHKFIRWFLCIAL